MNSNTMEKKKVWPAARGVGAYGVSQHCSKDVDDAQVAAELAARVFSEATGMNVSVGAGAGSSGSHVIRASRKSGWKSLSVRKGDETFNIDVVCGPN